MEVTWLMQDLNPRLEKESLAHGLTTLWEEIFEKMGPNMFTGKITSATGFGGSRDVLPLPFLGKGGFRNNLLVSGLAASLNWLFGAKPLLGAELTGRQQDVLERLLEEVSGFLERFGEVQVSFSGVEVNLSKKAISYEGSELYTAESFAWSNLDYALPPAGLAGRVELLPLCSPSIQELLLHPERSLKPLSEVELPLSTPGVWCSDQEWCRVAVNLVDQGILEAEAIPFSPITVGGKPVLNGLFSNALQQPILGDMGLLPHHSMWSSLSLPRGQVLLWSSEDLKCAFYLFSLPPCWRPYMAISTQVPGHLLGSSESWVYLSVRVLPMGWLSACGVIQHVHRRLILSSPNSLFKASREIRRDLVVPILEQTYKALDVAVCQDEHTGIAVDAFPNLWQVYIYIERENLDCLELCPSSLVHHFVGTVCESIASARDHYADVGVLLSTNKSVQRSVSAASLGVEVLGDQGWICVPREFVGQLVSLTMWVLARRLVPRKYLQILAGRWIRVFMLRRPSMGCFSELWRLLVSGNFMVRMTRKLQQELLGALGVLPLLKLDLRLPTSSDVSASDASLFGGALVQSVGLTPSASNVFGRFQMRF
eukprot:4077458-Amphidinium_carterae.2